MVRFNPKDGSYIKIPIPVISIHFSNLLSASDTRSSSLCIIVMRSTYELKEAARRRYWFTWANGLSQLDFVFGKHRLIHNNVERSIHETDKLFAIVQQCNVNNVNQSLVNIILYQWKEKMHEIILITSKIDNWCKIKKGEGMRENLIIIISNCVVIRVFDTRAYEY